MGDALLSLIKEQPGTLNLALHEPPPLICHFPSEYVLFCQTCLCKLVQGKVYSPPPRTEIPSTTTNKLHHNQETKKNIYSEQRQAHMFLVDKQIDSKIQYASSTLNIKSWTRLYRTSV